MARYDSKILKISKISKVTPYGFRYRLRDDVLKASLKRFGMLMPIVVTNAERPVVIAGHKRFFAAQALKLKPQIAGFLMSKGMHCLGCAIAEGESLDQAAEVHGLNPDDLIKELNGLE